LVPWKLTSQIGQPGLKQKEPDVLPGVSGMRE
jgi:hypothetical protein